MRPDVEHPHHAAAPDAPRSASPLPLQGVRVLDLSRLLPGGFCSLLLADYGADVLKVEDTTRTGYERLIRLYIRPVLGDVPIGRVTGETGA